MEKKRRSSSAGPPREEAMSRSYSRRSLRMSTRVKKAPPPPPPPVAKQQPVSNGRPPLSSTPGEDSAFDEALDGHMDIQVVLPDLKKVHMTVDRRTPMMDLLVHATTANKISPGGHIINVISKDERNVPYKPNTPIGSLDAHTVYIIPKSTLELPVKRMPKLANQPFEQTFRLQVNLPQNQRMVLRVSPRITLAELKSQICSDKELDHSSHHLVHPAQPDTILDLNATLEVYGCAEISLMSNSGLRDSIQRTSTNIYPIPRIEEEKKKPGIFRIFTRKKKGDFSVENTNGSNGSIPTSHSENSSLNKRNSYQPKQSIKRKPAPPPPAALLGSSPPLITQSSNSLNSRPESEISVKTADEVEGSISHSRHSSDSSGYHEPSVFSDCSENKSPEASIVHGGDEVKRASMSDLRHAPSCSNVSVVSASRKRKAPLPPVLPAIESPSTPDPPPLRESKSLEDVHQQESKASHQESKTQQHSQSLLQKSEAPEQQDRESRNHRESESQQESEALQYLEDVLQESENSNNRNFSAPQRVLDDSDTDSLRDEGEVISVCTAEVHANDQDSSDSVVEPLTVVTPDPSVVALPKSSFAVPNSQPDRHEVVDADDSGLSQTLTSDADSSLPSLNSDLKAMSDSGCHEEIYCNVSDSLDTKSVPSSDEFHVHEDIVENIAGEQAQETSNSSLLQNCLEEEDLKVDQAVSTEESSERSISLEEIHTVPKTLESIMDVPTMVAEVPSLQPSPPKEENPDSKFENISDKVSITGSSVSLDSPRSSTTHTPQLQKKLDNFALGCYQKESDIDIYSAPSPEDHPSNKFNSENRKEIEPPVRRKKTQPDVKITSFKERSLKDSGDSFERVNVSEKRAQLSNSSTLPLTGRSTSLFNLVPQKKLHRATTEIIEDEELVNGNMKRTHSDQNIAKDLEAVEMKDTFLQEQKRLQEEYRRLQEQFISWQKQLLSNQNLLQNEKIVPQMPFPSLEGLTSLDSNIHAKLSYEDSSKQKSDTNINYNDYKTRSLPRPKTKPLSVSSVKDPGRPKTPPLSQAASDTAVVDIDINAKVPARRPESITSCSVDTQVSFNQDKIVQVPPPQDKDTQVPSPQEKVTSGTQVPSPETILNKDTSAQTSEVIQTSSSSDISLSSPESENNSKSQTLPRPKPKPISALPPSQTMTLNRNSRPKSQVVSVTIGSWHQRQPADLDIEKSNNVASTRSKFLSMENIPQESAKPVYSTIEKRKLPPVPTETVPKTVVKSTEPKQASVTMAKSIVMSSTKPKGVEEIKPDVDKKVATKVPVANEARGVKTVPKQVEDTNVKQKSDIKLASREPTATFKLAKPFVKLSSMKDETHTPSIIGLRKWPLSEISETDGKQSILDDLRASSKRPGGYTQDKIRRAEVDLRKPKSSKQQESATTVPKTVDDSNEASKLHITTKVTVTSKPSATTTTDSRAPPKHSSSTSNAHGSVSRSQTLPKSMSLNSELLSVFSKKAAEKQETAVKQKPGAHQTVTVVNGTSAPPPPPLPSTSNTAMPTIPPAEQIPVSSQLLMARETKTLPAARKDMKKKSPSKFSRTSDPREELMLEIRGFGGKQALRKPPMQPGWNLKVYGTASTAST